MQQLPKSLPNLLTDARAGLRTYFDRSQSEVEFVTAVTAGGSVKFLPVV